MVDGWMGGAISLRSEPWSWPGAKGLGAPALGPRPFGALRAASVPVPRAEAAGAADAEGGLRGWPVLCVVFFSFFLPELPFLALV